MDTSVESKKPKVYLGLLGLVCLCLGPMVGTGLFALPQNLAQGGGLIASIIAMSITFVGMYCLARTFQYLAARLQQNEASLYTYAKNCFGDYVGFCSAWGYWVAGWTSNVAYLLMICSALNYFFPIFGQTLSLNTIIVSSILLWSVIGICALGLKFSATLNIITTIAKIIPIFIFLAICSSKFNLSIFQANLTTSSTTSLLSQVKNIMLITAWIFVGIEGASVFNTRAQNSRLIGTATISSFLLISLIYLALVVLSFGVVPEKTLANLAYPPIGSLAQQLIGNLGSTLINTGLILAVAGAFFSWILLTAQVPYIAGKVDKLFPKIFCVENKQRAPIGSLIIIGICEELYLILAYFSNFNYLETITIAVTMMIPVYLLSAIEYLRITWKRRLVIHYLSFKNIFFSVIAILYSCWLFYSADKYFIYSSILFMIGNVIYVWNGYRIKKTPILNRKELFLFMLISFSAIMSGYSLFWR